METAERVWQVALQFEMDAQAGKMKRFISKHDAEYSRLKEVSNEQADVLWWLGIPVYCTELTGVVGVIYHPPIRLSYLRGRTFYTLVEAEDSEGET